MNTPLTDWGTSAPGGLTDEQRAAIHRELRYEGCRVAALLLLIVIAAATLVMALQ